MSLAGDGETFLRELRAQLAQQGLEVEGKYDNELLVHVHGLSHRDFIEHHTLFPYQWAVWNARQLPRWGRQIRSAIWAPRNGAWFCPKCALEDKASRGYSYWRRVHQLAGVNRCPYHRDTALQVLNSWPPFDQQPHANIDRTSPATDVIATKREWDLIFKFTEISIGLLSASYPKSSKAAQSLIGNLAVSSGICAGQHAAYPQRAIRRYAEEQLPKAWSAANFPKLYSCLMWAASLPYSEAWHYALALALVSDSATVALAEWETLPSIV